MPQFTLDVMTPEHREILLRTLSAHFRLPALRCHIRKCRRDNACAGRPAASGAKPACFGHLHPKETVTFDELMVVLNEIYRGTLWPPPAKAARRKWLEDNAIAIFRASLPRMPERAAGFERVHARFIAPPAPPVDVKAFLAEAKLELIRMEQEDAVRETLLRSPTGRQRMKNAANP